MNSNELSIDYPALGARIRARRRELGLTQERLAERVGISTPFVGHLERAEKVPSLETVVRLSAALELPLDALVLGRRSLGCRQEGCPLYEDLATLVQAYSDP